MYDFVQHTFFECSAFDIQRETLNHTIGSQLFLKTWNEALLAEEDKRYAGPTFCREVLRLTEEIEICLGFSDSTRRE